ncbi:MAG: methyltransferase [Gammaproteobacteria bacterium]
MPLPKIMLVAVALTLAISAPARAMDAETSQALDAALNGSQRSAENKARDIYRHPRATLDFLGLEAHMTVIELWPGGGWYTEILAPTLRGSGKLITAHYGANTGSEYRTQSYLGFVEKLAGAGNIYDQVKVIEFGKGAGNALGQDNSADMVLVFRNIHSLIRGGLLEQFLKAAMDVLKPGGVLGIVQHRSIEIQDLEMGDENILLIAKSGYVPERYVVTQAEAAGFTLDGTSEINANPKDLKEYPQGVWTLPPSLRLGDVDRETYISIGESDRMTLRFVKPALADAS